MFRNCLPTTVKSCQIMWSDASTQLLSPHSTPGQSHFWMALDASQPSRSLCHWWEREERHNAIWLPQQLNMISITSSHNQQAHYSILWPRTAENPCNTWELQHCVPANKNYPAVLSKSPSKNTTTETRWISLPWGFTSAIFRWKFHS